MSATPLETVSVEGAAELMNIHKKTVLELIHSGALRAAKMGRAWTLLRSDVLAHIEREIINQTSARMRAPLPAGARAATRGVRRGQSRAGSRSA